MKIMYPTLLISSASIQISNNIDKGGGTYLPVTLTAIFRKKIL